MMTCTLNKNRIGMEIIRMLLEQGEEQGEACRLSMTFIFSGQKDVKVVEKSKSSNSIAGSNHLMLYAQG